MARSRTHRRAQTKAAGKGGKTEVPLKSGRRLDVRRGDTGEEIERSGQAAKLRQAARRLQQSRAPRKVLRVPQQHMPKAAKAMQEEDVHGTVKNMGGTKRRSV